MKTIFLFVLMLSILLAARQDEPSPAAQRNHTD
jgi:hypothetical protein